MTEAEDPQLDEDFIPAKFPGVSEIVALGAGVVPFFVSFNRSSSTTVNGEVVEASFFDPVAVGAGVVAALAALYGLVLLRKTMAAQRTLRIVAAVILLGLGGYQIVRGLGMI